MLKIILKKNYDNQILKLENDISRGKEELDALNKKLEKQKIETDLNHEGIVSSYVKTIESLELKIQTLELLENNNKLNKIEYESNLDELKVEKKLILEKINELEYEVNETKKQTKLLEENNRNKENELTFTRNSVSDLYENIKKLSEENKSKKIQLEANMNLHEIVKIHIKNNEIFRSCEIQKVQIEKNYEYITINCKDRCDENLEFKNLNINLINIDQEIYLLIKNKAENIEKLISFRKNIDKNIYKQIAYIKEINQTEYQEVKESIDFIDKILKNNYKDVDIGEDIDIIFYNPFLRKLIAEQRREEKSLRFDNVKIKQELVQKDYEHLWLEINNLTFMHYNLEKLEIRISSSNKSSGFYSRMKIEFPLIDNLSKPFPNWYKESIDAYGEKFELRFDNDKKTMDVITLNKTKQDAIFIAVITLSIDEILKKINNINLLVTRSLDEWLGLANNMALIISKYKK